MRRGCCRVTRGITSNTCAIVARRETRRSHQCDSECWLVVMALRTKRHGPKVQWRILPGQRETSYPCDFLEGHGTKFANGWTGAYCRLGRPRRCSGGQEPGGPVPAVMYSSRRLRSSTSLKMAAGG